MLERRTTVFEEALFAASGSRRGELLRKFQIPADALLELAVSHELGHALCQEKDEDRTNTYSRYLREGQLPACHHSSVSAHSAEPVSPGSFSGPQIAVHCLPPRKPKQ
jgi:hypothetical protein